jgi:uncharacterized lipoprotein
MKASTAPGAVSAWRWTAPASPWKTATARRVRISCATSIDATKKDGFFSKLFSWGSSSDKDKEAQRYRVLVKAGKARPAWSASSATKASRTSPVAEKILGLLHDQLK